MAPEQQARPCAVPHCMAPAAGPSYCQAHEAHEKMAGVALRALGNTPDSPDLHFDLATAYRHLGRYEAALAEYQEAVRLSPTNIDARYWLGRTYILTGDLLAATEECLAMEEIAPDRAADLAGALQEYTHPGVTFDAGPGDTIGTAVIIRGAPTSSIGVNAEYHYLTQQFGARDLDWKLERQSLLQTADRAYDKMEIVLTDGSRRVVFFDITEFWARKLSAEVTDRGGPPSVPSTRKKRWQFWR